YYSCQVLMQTKIGFPLIGKQVGPDQYVAVPDGEVFTMTPGDTAFVLVHLDHQAQVLRARVRDAATGRNWHYAFNLTHLPRNSTADSFFAFEFDGTTMNPSGAKQFTVPDGTYVLELEAL